jgi:hypothetical protein
MDSSGVLLDAFDRVRDGVHGVLDGLTEADLNWQPAGSANPIGWLLWHLLRVQDDHVADAFVIQQVWTSADWVSRFALPIDAGEIGYGHTVEQVRQIHLADTALLAGYCDAVHEQTAAQIRSVQDDDLERIVDERWDPPVTLGVRLISVIADDLQHLGQAAYVRGLRSAGGR